MSTNAVTSNVAKANATVAAVDMKLEVIVIPSQISTAQTVLLEAVPYRLD